MYKYETLAEALAAMPWLVINGTEGEAELALKTEMHVTLDLPMAERVIAVHTQWINQAEGKLLDMMDEMKADDMWIARWARMAAEAIADWDADGDDAKLEVAEQYTQLATSVRAARWTLKDIKQQRERVQWERSLLIKKQQTMKNND